MKCKLCDGNGMVKCSKCNGKSFDNMNRKCAPCTGEGVIVCVECKGTGKVRGKIMQLFRIS